MIKEWPLVAFTILSQMAVGAFLLLCPLLFASPAGASWPPTARAMVLVVWGMTASLVAIASALSFFHLHHPFRAHRALANLRTSWLSREILFELAFLALVALAFLLVWKGHTSGLFLRAVMAVAALAGILFLVSMGKLYVLRSVPPWEAAYIGVSFFLTTMMLGAMSTAWITGSSGDAGWSYLSALWTAALFFAAAGLLFAAFLTPVFGLAGHRPSPSLRPPARVSLLLHLARLALSAGGLVFIIMALSAAAPGGPALTLAFALILASEVAGRFLFYGLAPRPGD